MMFTRNPIASAALALVSLLVLAGMALAQAPWPARAVHFVVPYPPGGASDITARLMGQKLSELWGQPVVIENRAGANGIVALEYVAKQPADGYTLLFANLGPNAINPAVYAKLPYDPITDFTPITLTTLVPQVLVATPSLEQKTLQQVLDYARANPGKINYGHGGNGSANHLGVELVTALSGASFTAVPYKGDAPAMLDTMSGQVSLSYPTVPAALPHIKSGKLRALAVGTKTRVPALPEVPTMQEAGVPGYEAFSWGGVMGPGAMPTALVNRIHADIVKVLKSPDVQEKLAAQGAIVVAEGPADFAKFLASEIRKWDAVAKKAGIHLD
ncbi:MAG TPA: tripartite tricarboxylate transporter substrate binding protein [Casimicrobiaceae bacterium]|nr:tripartite tricarboxylate transporter substrate binding protein [Casimicrobiaceae bacterium]